jgi:hypothetical protein
MVDVVSTAAGLLLLAWTALATVSALRIRGRAPFFIAYLVACGATIVLLVELLSLFDALTRPAILIGHLVLACVGTGAWLATGRPRPPRIGRLGVRVLVEATRNHPAAAILSAFVLIALVVQLVVAIGVCPNNWDSMTYHLSRAAYWLQHESAMQWPDGSIRQNFSPPNAEMLVAWTMSLRGTDQLANVVQWTALIGIAGGIFSICRLIAFPIAASLFAAACFVAMPQPMLQATSTQNDLVVSFFIVGAILFGIRSLRDRSLGDLAVAATSIGLGIGTKGTTLIAGPSLALVVGYALWRYRPPRRFVLIACAAVLCGVVAFGAFNYVQSFRNTGTAYGPIKSMVERTSPLRLNVGRVMWTFADSPGTAVPWLELGLKRPFQGVFGGLKHPRFGLEVDATIQEDTSAFGLVGLLVFLPILLVTALRPRSPPWHRTLALAGLGYILSFAVTSEWNPWIGRVLVPGVAIGAPLLAGVALRPWLAGVVLALAVAGLVPSVLMNPQKPLLVERRAKTVFGLDRLQQQTLIRPEMHGVLSAMNARMGATAPLGYVGGEDSWDYPLFGEHRERRVVRLKYAQVNIGVMAFYGLTGVLFSNAGPPPASLVAHEIAKDHYLVLAREQLAR